MNKIEQLAQQAQEATQPNEQLAMIILILQDAIRRLKEMK
jgi:hypothetical protein